MRNGLITFLFLSLFVGESRAQIQDFVNAYCAGCHNQTRAEGRVAFNRQDLEQPNADPDKWERVLRQLRARTMPPVGARHPDDGAFRTVIDKIAESLDRGDAEARRETRRARMSDLELAARLSKFLWNGAPDQPLLEDAKRGKLREPAVLKAQVRRMLSDAKAKAIVTEFFVPWLSLDRLSTLKPQQKTFPEFDENLRGALLAESELFLESQLRQDSNPVELWTANYTFVNERLARHYDIPGVSGSEFRRVTLKQSERAGLLGQAAILTITTRHDATAVDAPFTSPATRGKWVRIRFLGVNTPPPFSNDFVVQPVPLSRQDRTLPANPCTNCHLNFFPLGYGLENFDGIGRWRTDDGAGPVDASGVMTDGSTFNGPAELRRELVERSDAFLTTITERLLAYAIGGKDAALSTDWRGLFQTAPAHYMPTVRAILRDASREDYRWSSLIAGIAASELFQAK